VILDPADRAGRCDLARRHQPWPSPQGLEVVEDKGLLAEVAGLVEWPVVLMGEIGADFLDLPPEVLQTSMKEHQKFFSVRRTPRPGRIEKFVTVANRETADTAPRSSRATARCCRRACRMPSSSGKTTCAWRRRGWATGAEALKSVTFQRQTGLRQADRVDRIAALAAEIAPTVGADPDQAARRPASPRPTCLGDGLRIPRASGVMGRYYAKAAGHPTPSPPPAAEHYAPSARPTTCRPRRCRSPWRWPTRSTR
jgi:glycyl-tRNA synthetase beta chain